MLATAVPNRYPSTGHTVNEDSTRQIVLIIEDDPTVSQLIRLYMVRENYVVLTASDGVEGLRLARERRPALVLLDLSLPGMDGLAVCRAIRAESQTPVIMVTARVDENDRLAGLDLGADDYISKPFSPRELAARVRAVLRRASREHPIQDKDSDERGLTSGNIEVNLKAQSVEIGGVPVTLTPTEYRILVSFMRAPGRVFKREQLIEAVFGYEFDGMDRTIDTHISNLRKKVETLGGQKPIKTVYGSGYRFDAE